MTSASLQDDLQLSPADLRAIAAVVYQKSGITLHEGKQAFVVARLQKRLRALGLQSYSEYLHFVEHDDDGDELVQLLDAIATNHTSFFREPQHFAFLRDRVVPEFRARKKTGPFNLWCFPCSTGEEPVTIALTLLEAFPVPEHDRIQILAADLSTKALGVARRAVYPLARVRDVPVPLLKKYFEKGSGEQEGLARVGPLVRRHIAYERANLLEITDAGRRFDVIFCRNVMIYFDQSARQRTVSMLERHLAPGGHLFIAHSESLNGIKHGLQWVAPAAFRLGGA